MIGISPGSAGGVRAPVPSVRANALSAIAFSAAALDAPRPLLPLSGAAAAPAPSLAFPVPAPARAAEIPAAATFSAAPAGVSVGPARAVVSYDVAFESLAKSTGEDLASLGVSYEQTRQQGRGWYHMSVVAAGVGLCIVAVAVIALILGHVTTGIVTTVSSVLPNVVAAIFFGQSKRADDRVDAVAKELSDARAWTARVQIAESIKDTHLQDELKAEIVRKMIEEPKSKA
jgi:hypothetical protein